MPDGMVDSALRNPLNFDRREWFQAKRTGQDPRVIKELFQQCWASSDSGKAFQQALQQRGYFLARGDRRAVVAVDVYGEVYAVARWANIKSKEVVQRMGDVFALPSVEDTRAKASLMVRDKLKGLVGSITKDFANAAQAMEAKRLVMVERHRAARNAVQTAQDQRWTKEAIERRERFSKGLRGLWDRVTGKHQKLKNQNEREPIVAADRDAREKQTLIQRQLEERQFLQRQLQSLRRAYSHDLTQLYREIDGEKAFKHTINGSGQDTFWKDQALKFRT